MSDIRMITGMTSGAFSIGAPTGADRPLPEGVRDLLFEDAADWRALEAALRDAWRAWGYGEIILPTFEYASTLATDVGAQVDAEMYRFFDRHGRTLALRPDMTIPTARVVGTRLFDQPLPLRIAYAGSVFRHEAPRAGKQHEFTQAGIELIGAPTRAADAEVVALAIEALRVAGLRDFRITVGHVGYFRGLLRALEVSQKVAGQLRDAVNRKAEAELERMAHHALGAAQDHREAITSLPRLAGGRNMLDEALSYAMHPLMEAAVEELAALYGLLMAYGFADVVDFDLSEVKDLDYYTGITFEGFAPGLGFSLVSGGRYDELVAHFGPSFPAVGWALTLDRLVLAREAQGAERSVPASDILLSGKRLEDSIRWAGEARRRGLRVEIDPLELDPQALWSAAQERRIARSLAWNEQDQLEVWHASGRSVIESGAWEEVLSWR